MSGEHDEITQRTQLAIDASHQAFKAQSIAQRAERTAKRVKLWHGIALMAASLIGCGYALRHRVEDFATKQEVEQLKVDQATAAADRKLMWDRLQTVCSSQSRIEDKLDDLKNTLIRERRNGR